jgi:hypothetical protein
MNPISRSWRLKAFVVALCVALTHAAQAACPLDERALVVRVADADDRPLAGASVEASWRERDGTQDMRITRETDATGQARLMIQFDPYSGRSFGGKERCEAKLARVALRVRKTGYADVNSTVEPNAFDQPVAITLKAR